MALKPAVVHAAESVALAFLAAAALVVYHTLTKFGLPHGWPEWKDVAFAAAAAGGSRALFALKQYVPAAVSWLFKQGWLPVRGDAAKRAAIAKAQATIDKLTAELDGAAAGIPTVPDAPASTTPSETVPPRSA